MGYLTRDRRLPRHAHIESVPRHVASVGGRGALSLATAKAACRHRKGLLRVSCLLFHGKLEGLGTVTAGQLEILVSRDHWHVGFCSGLGRCRPLGRGLEVSRSLCSIFGLDLTRSLLSELSYHLKGHSLL